MDLKKLYMNNKAVSPVIGVILMVAITVILAAAIGASVFGHGTTQPAPQANLDIKAGNIYKPPVGITPGQVATVKIQHLGGDPINFDAASTKVVVSINGGSSETIDTTVVAALGVLNVGDIKTLNLGNNTNPLQVVSGNNVDIRLIDIKTNQLISDKNVRF